MVGGASGPKHPASAQLGWYLQTSEAIVGAKKIFAEKPFLKRVYRVLNMNKIKMNC